MSQCPTNKTLTTTNTVINYSETLRYLAGTSDCRGCSLKLRCCPKPSFRRIPRSIYEEAPDIARALAKSKAFEQSHRERKRVDMLFAHLNRILKLGCLWLRGPRGAQYEFTSAAIAQNLRRLAKPVIRPPPMAAACAAYGLPKVVPLAQSHRRQMKPRNRPLQDSRQLPRSFNRRLLQQNRH
jgi:hypothetical protein